MSQIGLDPCFSRGLTLSVRISACSSILFFSKYAIIFQKRKYLQKLMDDCCPKKSAFFFFFIPTMIWYIVFKKAEDAKLKRTKDKHHQTQQYEGSVNSPLKQISWLLRDPLGITYSSCWNFGSAKWSFTKVPSFRELSSYHELLSWFSQSFWNILNTFCYMFV